MIIEMNGRKISRPKPTGKRLRCYFGFHDMVDFVIPRSIPTDAVIGRPRYCKCCDHTQGGFIPLRPSRYGGVVNANRCTSQRDDSDIDLVQMAVMADMLADDQQEERRMPGHGECVEASSVKGGSVFRYTEPDTDRHFNSGHTSSNDGSPSNYNGHSTGFSDSSSSYSSGSSDYSSSSSDFSSSSDSSSSDW